jgi:hypothetical protein
MALIAVACTAFDIAIWNQPRVFVWTLGAVSAAVVGFRIWDSLNERKQNNGTRP